MAFFIYIPFVFIEMSHIAIQMNAILFAHFLSQAYIYAHERER